MFIAAAAATALASTPQIAHAGGGGGSTTPPPVIIVTGAQGSGNGTGTLTGSGLFDAPFSFTVSGSIAFYTATVGPDTDGGTDMAYTVANRTTASDPMDPNSVKPVAISVAFPTTTPSGYFGTVDANVYVAFSLNGAPGKQDEGAGLWAVGPDGTLTLYFPGASWTGCLDKSLFKVNGEGPGGTGAVNPLVASSDF